MVTDLVEIGIRAVGPIKATQPFFCLKIEVDRRGPATFRSVDSCVTCAQECQTCPEQQDETDTPQLQLRYEAS